MGTNKTCGSLLIPVSAVCTLLTGGAGFQDMALFDQSKRAWLYPFLALPHGIPSPATFGRVCARLTPQRFQEGCLAWTRAVAQLTQGPLLSRALNNRWAHAHRPTRQRAYRMQGLKSAGQAQRLLSASGPIAQPFRSRRHLLSASASRTAIRHRFESWAEITGRKWAASASGRWPSRPESACRYLGTILSPTT